MRNKSDTNDGDGQNESATTEYIIEPESYEIIEQRIGYTFKNKDLLTEALMHPTYRIENNYTRCYERMEFFGDAIIG